MTGYLAVAAGGALGAVLRFVVARLLTTPTAPFPFATLLINLLGSFVLGVLVRAWPAVEPAPAWRLFLTVGLCGGFTTFSTLSAELFALLEQQHWLRALTYVVASVLGGLAAVALGVVVGARFATTSS